MEGVEGVISMMDEDIEADEEGEKDGREGEKEDDNVEEEEERGGVSNAGLQSLLFSEILQFRTSQLRRVRVGGESMLESESVVESESVENEETLNDISLFTTDSGNEAGYGIVVSNQVSQKKILLLSIISNLVDPIVLPKNLCSQTSMPLIVSTSPDINRSGILRCF